MPALLPSQSVADLKADLGGSNEQAYITCVAPGGTFEVQKIVCPAVAAMAQGAFFKLVNAAGTKIAVWFDIDADGTEPNGAIYTACDVKIEVDVVTGDLAADVATKALAAIVAEGDFALFSASRSGADLTFTSTIKGNLTAPASYVEAETAGPFTASTPTGGADPDLQAKYFTFSKAGTNYYGWFTSNGAGVDPAPSGTGVPIALVGSETTAAQVATLAAAALEALAGISAVADGDRVVLKVDAIGPVTDVGAGDSGFTVAVQSQGVNSSFLPSGNYGAGSNAPSAIS